MGFYGISHPILLRIECWSTPPLSKTSTECWARQRVQVEFYYLWWISFLTLPPYCQPYKINQLRKWLQRKIRAIFFIEIGDSTIDCASFPPPSYILINEQGICLNLFQMLLWFPGFKKCFRLLCLHISSWPCLSRSSPWFSIPAILKSENNLCCFIPNSLGYSFCKCNFRSVHRTSKKIVNMASEIVHSQCDFFLMFVGSIAHTMLDFFKVLSWWWLWRFNSCRYFLSSEIINENMEYYMLCFMANSSMSVMVNYFFLLFLVS